MLVQISSNHESRSGATNMPEDFEGEHNGVLGEAMKVYVQKSRTRGQMWMDFPPSDKIRELKERVRRLETGYQHIRFLSGEPGPDLDVEVRDILIEDAIDTINYATFFVKQLRRGQRG